jgi:type II secretory pathway pseudopilin PulG
MLIRDSKKNLIRKSKMSFRKQNKSLKNQSGFTFIELAIGVVITFTLLSIAGSFIADAKHTFNINSAAKDIGKVAIAVQRRNAHDGYLFSHWDENGGRAPINSTLSWDSNDMDEFYTDYLVGRLNPSCGNDTDGWNPLNNLGTPDDGAETSMERAALINCSELRNRLPFDVSLSAALSPDANDTVSKFALYLDTSNVDFGAKNDETNNFLNLKKWSLAFEDVLRNGTAGSPNVFFGTVGQLDDVDDDEIYTDTECEDELTNGDECSLIIHIDFAGLTNGRMKRTDNQDFFVDDVTFADSLAATDRQRCAYYEQDLATGLWDGQMVDCAIKAGVGDNEVVLVSDGVVTNDIRISPSKNAAGDAVAIDAFCNAFVKGDDDELVVAAAPLDQTPCGITVDGAVVQMLTDELHVATTAYAGEIVAGPIMSSDITIFNTTPSTTAFQILDSTGANQVFVVDNDGRTLIDSTLTVRDDATFETNAQINEDLTVGENVTFGMIQNTNTITFGDGGNSSLTLSRDGTGTFTMQGQGNELRIASNDDGEGVRFVNDGDETTIRMLADNGVVAENGTSFHNSKSTLSSSDFDAAGISTESLRRRSELVTADMAKYLDDTSSPIQIVGVDRIEGAYMQMTKPDCLYFLDDNNYSSPEANPYRDIIGTLSTTDGQSLARLLLVPTYFKTYNSAFGDNQIYAQHAAHASSSAWDIYLYLSGEGAFDTGAREDGAGGSMAITLCDYSSLNLSQQTF